MPFQTQLAIGRKRLDDRAKQHLKWPHSPSADDDDDEVEEGALSIIAGDVLWKVGDAPSIAGARSKAFPTVTSLAPADARMSMPCGGHKCQIHNSQCRIKCYHAGIFKVCTMCKCGREKLKNCFLCTPDLLKTTETKRVKHFQNKMVKMATTMKYLTSTSLSQILNKTLSTCFALANGKLAPRPQKYLKNIALEVTDFPDRAVWLARIVDKLVLTFSEHLQYRDVFAGQISLTDDQFTRAMSARADGTGNPMEIGEVWCSARLSRYGDQSAAASTFTAAMMKEDQTASADFKRYWHWTNTQLLDSVKPATTPEMTWK